MAHPYLFATSNQRLFDMHHTTHNLIQTPNQRVSDKNQRCQINEYLTCSDMQLTFHQMEHSPIIPTPNQRVYYMHPTAQYIILTSN